MNNIWKISLLLLIFILILRIVTNYEKKGHYPQQTLPQTGFAPQSGFAHETGLSADCPQSNFSSVYGDDMPPPDQHVSNSDQEPMVKGFEFSDMSIRRGFIRKVYSILSIQLLLTLGFVLLCTYHDSTQLFVRKSPSLLYVAVILSFSTVIVLCCCESARRTSPNNMIYLSLFTLSEAYMVGFVTVSYKPEVVEMAILFTTVVVIALTVFAMQTKWDFTTCGGTLFVTLWIFILIGFIMAFIPKTDPMIIVMSSFGAIFFSIYLIYDTQLIIGGGHKFSISPEEYVLAAITLFLDILNIFLYILRILAAATKNS